LPSKRTEKRQDEEIAFFASLRHDAHYLFINSDIPTCITRIKARADDPRSLDDRYVPDHIFVEYYQRDHRQYMTEVAQQLKRQFGVPLEHIHVIDNGPAISMRQFYQAVESLANDVLGIKV
jgi:hypothetical protein